MALARVVPQFARHGEFVPEEGGKLNVMLPGELITSLVLKVSSRDIAIVELAVYYDAQGVRKLKAVLGKSHSYKAGDVVAVQRGQDAMNVEQWFPLESKHDIDKAERMVAAAMPQPQPEEGLSRPPETAAPEIGSGPAAEPETQEAKKVLGPRRSRIKRSEPDPTQRRVLGPRRSKISRPQEAASQ